MDWQALLTPEIQTFILENQGQDVHALALKKPPHPDWPYALILDQIKSRQKAKTKIPTWLEHQNIILPPSDTLEQGSSQACAKYKASLFKGKTFVDLTGGASIDSWAMLENFDHASILDCDEAASTRIAHNLKMLSDKNVTVKNENAEDFIQNMQSVDLAIIDPQRRNQSRKGLYKLEECSPDITSILPYIKAKQILLKTSPMLDIDQAIKQLTCVQAVHVVEWQGECKEILLTLSLESPKNQNPPITAVKIDNHGAPINMFSYTREEEKEAHAEINEPQKYLYEPSPAFIKAGGYKSIASRYKAPKIHLQTHLYTSNIPIQDFPGRSFEIIDTYPAKSKKLPIQKANLKTRNFPQDTATLKKKLNLKDGGEDYLFACTMTNSKTTKNLHAIIHCKKIK